MKKNIIIWILSIAVLTLWFSREPEKAAQYWLKRCIAAEDVIYRVYEDNDIYYMDVLQESNEFSEWITLAEQQEELGGGI